MPSSRYYKFKEVSRKERVKKLKISFFSVAALSFLLIVLWSVFFSSFFKIENIDIVPDNAHINREDIAKTISRIAPFGLDKNLLLVSKSNLKSELAASFPAITDITVKKNLLHTLAVSFKNRIPIGIWCHPTGGEPQADDCYYFDKEGIIFMSAPQTEGSLILKITDFSKSDVSLGSNVLASSRIDFVINFINAIGTANAFKILEFKVKPSSSVDLEAVTDTGWLIYLDDKQDPKAAANNLMTILDEAVKNSGNLEYIDLRIPSRIFYKLK